MAQFTGLRAPDARILVVTGHYGSGKTEFCVSLAMRLARLGYGPYERLSLIDLDIANPYFRSRERKQQLEAAGVGVYGSAYDHEITAEMPALGANIRAPLEDKGCRVIVDVGGNDSGAVVLNQFSKYLGPENALFLIVVNANRPETRSLEGALEHLRAIEEKTGRRMDGVINNCHLLRQTDAECVARGHRLCRELCDSTGLLMWCDCYPEGIVDGAALKDRYEYLMPLGMYMRPSWIDK
ncbi:MAG: ATP-binding protein [Clostridia bacterium]|nr:ATP-binding protein [Clostridia bacterium]